MLSEKNSEKAPTKWKEAGNKREKLIYHKNILIISIRYLDSKNNLTSSHPQAVFSDR
jgi:hypothetical protein